MNKQKLQFVTSTEKKKKKKNSTPPQGIPRKKKKQKQKKTKKKLCDRVIRSARGNVPPKQADNNWTECRNNKWKQLSFTILKLHFVFLPGAHDFATDFKWLCASCDLPLIDWVSCAHSQIPLVPLTLLLGNFACQHIPFCIGIGSLKVSMRIMKPIFAFFGTFLLYSRASWTSL